MKINERFFVDANKAVTPVESLSVGHKVRLGIIANQAFSVVNFRGPLIREMTNSDVTVFALAPDYDDISRAAVLELGAIPVDSSMSRSGMNPFRDLFDVYRLVRQLRRLELDMVFAYFIKPVIYGMLAARIASVPKRFAMIEGVGYVFTMREDWPMRRKMLRALAIRLYKLSLSQAKCVFFLNPDDKSFFVASGMVEPKKIRLLNGIGLDLERFHVAPLDLHGLCFIMVARLLLEKGVYDFISAARRVKKVCPNAIFLLVGGVDLNPGSISEEEVRVWVNEGLIVWPGNVADVRPWISKANVFVLPSYREGLPRSTQEAMAMGRPIITTDVPGCKETVIEGKNGFLVPIRDPVALAEAMMRFINQPSLISKMGRESRLIAEEKFNVHKINCEILSAIDIADAKSKL